MTPLFRFDNLGFGAHRMRDTVMITFIRLLSKVLPDVVTDYLDGPDAPDFTGAWMAWLAIRRGRRAPPVQWST